MTRTPAASADPPLMVSSQPYLVHAVAKTLDLLDAFDRPDARPTLAELTQRLGLPKSSVLRLLRTLESRGYVERSPDGARYQLGLKLFELGARVAARFEIREAALPVMARLRDQCGDTVNLGVLSGVDVLLIAVLESPHPLRKTAQVGDREPAHCTSLGKAILAHLPLAQVRQLLQPDRLEARTPHTIVDLVRLEEELELVRRTGYAVDDQEMLESVRCVGAPILDHAEQVRGAVSISGPVSRLQDARLLEIASMVRAAGLEISRSLGYPAAAWPALTAGGAALAPAYGPPSDGYGRKEGAEAEGSRGRNSMAWRDGQSRQATT